MASCILPTLLLLQKRRVFGNREALRVVQNLNLRKVIFEADKLTLVDACRGNKEVREMQNILTDFQFINSSFEACGFTWTKREGNVVVHEIASLRIKGALVGNWYAYPPYLLSID